MIEDYWGPSMKLLGDMKFLEALQTYDKDNIPGAVIKKIRDKFVDHPLFKPDVIRNVSTACEGLCKWVLAMEVYERVAKVVAPKKIKLAEAQGELEVQMTKLNAKRAELKAVSASKFIVPSFSFFHYSLSFNCSQNFKGNAIFEFF